MSEENTESSITTPIGGVSFKGKKTAEFIAIMCLFLLGLFGYILWEHKAEAKGNGDALVRAINEMAVSQRVTNCLMATPQDHRAGKLAECERIAR